MSHHLLSKKIWIGILLLSCVFLVIAYVWLYYTDQWILQAELPVQEKETEKEKKETDEIDSAVEEVNLNAAEPIKKGKPEMMYPCVIQMQQGEVGIYAEDGVYLQKLTQVGEWISEIDQKQLQQGIWIENEKELIMVLESYHLQ